MFSANTKPRVYAQNVLTGAWLHRDIDISQPQITRGLSGGDQFTFNITPVDRSLLDSTGNPIIQKWNTAIYFEESDVIRNGGIVTQVSATGPMLTVSGIGFTAYPNGYSYESRYSATNVDILDVVREIWSNVQSQTAGNIGVVLDSTLSGVKLGTTTQPVQTTVKNSNGTSTTKTVNQVVPYSLDWSNSTDCGQEIQNLADQCPFDFREFHTWADSTKQAVNHRMGLYVPRAGRRAFELRFAEGENIVQDPTITDDGTNYANNVVVQGAGTGTTTIRGATTVIDGHIRRNVVYVDQTITTAQSAQKMAASILPSYMNTDTVTQIVIKNHQHAVFGSFDVGDDILITIGSYWRNIQTWHRIISYTQDPTTDQMTLTLARSDSFTYQPLTGTAGTG